MEYSIDEWVANATRDRVSFRQGVHIVLSAIAKSEYLQPKMIMKGGMLLGIRYNSTRFTEDIDFSTNMKLSEINKDEFQREMNEALLLASDTLPYNIICAVQRFTIKPKEYQEATFPSFNLTIGYAKKSSPKEIKRLEQGQSINTIKIDYSFNELSCNIDHIILEDDDNDVKAYSLTDLISEKLRSIIQQPYRNRHRRQDIYDLNYLFNCVSLNEKELFSILTSLILKSKGRIPTDEIHRETLDREDIKKYSSIDYETLKAEIVDEIPPFDIAYKIVSDFYKSLPWDQINLENLLHVHNM